jgi:hypothetical protein
VNQVTFGVGFIFFKPEDLKVFVTQAGSPASDTNDILNLTVDYSVIQNPNYTGSITITNPNKLPQAGDRITIIRDMSNARANFYNNAGAFTSDAVNTDFESQVLMIQQNKMKEEKLNIHYNTSESVLDGDILLPVLGPNQFWKKDPTGLMMTKGTIPDPFPGGGTVSQVDTGDGLQGGPITGVGTVSLRPSGVVPGNYTSLNATVDQYGRITAAADGVNGTVRQVDTQGLATGGPITDNGTINVPVAQQADMQTPVSNALAVTPQNLFYYPGVAKAWVVFQGNNAQILGQHNIAQVVRNSTGNYTITFNFPFYLVSTFISFSYIGVFYAWNVVNQTTINVYFQNSLSQAVEPNNIHCLFFGIRA